MVSFFTFVIKNKYKCNISVMYYIMKKIYNKCKILYQKGDYMEEKLGKLEHDGRIYDLDDMNNIDVLEKLLQTLEKEEASIMARIETSIQSDLEEDE